MNLVVEEVQGKLIFNKYIIDLLCRSWMYGGIASRMAIELGLHENKESENANPTIEKLIEQETARKVFWCAFIMDK